MTEHSSVTVYGDSAVVVGIFHTSGVEKGKRYVNRERFVDVLDKNRRHLEVRRINSCTDSREASHRLGRDTIRRAVPAVKCGQVLTMHCSRFGGCPDSTESSKHGVHMGEYFTAKEYF